MPFLLKIARDRFSRERSFVAERLSDRDISQSDLGDTVYVWFTDSPGRESELAARARLADFTPGTGPQVRDPSRSTNGYFIGLSELDETITRSLSTDDLAPFRDDPETSPMHELGKLHDNRNQKIKRIADATAAVLAARF